MSGFKTRNSTYFVDNTRKCITGGIFGGKIQRFKEAIILIGFPAEIHLPDGNIVLTSTVQSYV